MGNPIQPEPEGKEFWRFLLGARREVTWGNFAWFSAKTLLLSLNDQISKRIEAPDTTGSIVDRRRMRWVSDQATRRDARSPDDVIRIPGSAGLVALGDPGEMDASQYVLVRDLARHRRSLVEDDGVSVALLMSDVVYPAGDINAWVDAVHLPYLGRPGQAWAMAHDAWTQESGARGFPAPFQRWTLLATPGNHDWYDGLNGFMFHAAGAEALEDVGYDEQGLTWRERLAKSWWRKPAPPQRELLEPLRRRAGGRDIVNGGPPGIPQLPGPYYAADLGCRDPSEHPHTAACEATMRLVMVDTGVTGTIDVEQAQWLRKMLDPRVPTPKIVVTGIPFAVNNHFSELTVADPELNLLHGDYAGEPRDLRSLLAGNPTVVATIAGDTHNYQRIDFTRSATPDELVRRGIPPLQVVAGGAGAYLSSAHPVRLEADGSLRLASPDGVHSTVVEPDGHVRFPTREGSLLHFSGRARPVLRILAALLVLAIVAMVMATRAVVAFRGDAYAASHDRGWLVGGPWALLAATALGPLACLLLPKAIPDTWTDPTRAWARRSLNAAAVCALVVMPLLVSHWTDVPTLLRVAAGALVVIALLLAQFVPPVLGSFPRLGRWWPTWVLAALLAVQIVRADPSRARLFHLLVAAVISGVALVVVYLARKDLLATCTRRRFLDPRFRWAVGFLHLVPALMVALVLFLAFVCYPGWVLSTAGVGPSHTEGGHAVIVAAQVGRVLYWSTLAVLCGGACAIASVWLMVKARFAVPRLLWALALVLAVAAGVATWLTMQDRAAEAWAGWRIAVVVLACALAPTVTLLAWLSRYVVRLPDPALTDLSGYLRHRDGDRSEPFQRTPSVLATALVSAIPSLDSMMEASEPPFAKNFLVVRTEKDGEQPGIHFVAYGLNNESGPDTRADRLPPECPRPGVGRGETPDLHGPRRGAFLLDHVVVDPQARSVSAESWDQLQTHGAPHQV